MSNEIIENLKTVQGQELKYGKLCEALELPKKSGESKVKQLKNLQMYCDLVRLEKPTRFVVNEVYENEIRAFEKVNGNNKYQTMFDAVVYQAFLENNGQPIYLSSTEMLQLFAEVNENFVYCYNDDQMCRLGEEYFSFSAMSKIARKILVGWTQRRLNNMHNRRLLEKGIAYRLYTAHKGQFGYFKVGHNVPVDSELHQKCMEIYAEAIEEVLPPSYLKMYKKSDNDIGEDDSFKKCWMPFALWSELNSTVTKLTKEKFEGKYCDLKEITILKPPTTDWIVDKLTKIYQTMPSLVEINSEACRKILTTAQLDEFTGVERKRFVDVSMSPKPKISIKDELKKADKKMEELEKE